MTAPTDIITTQTDPSINKVCPKCDRAVPATDFYPDSLADNGRSRYCADCRTAYNRYIYRTRPVFRADDNQRSRATKAYYRTRTSKFAGVDRNWSDQDVAYLRDNYSGMTVLQIAEKLHRTHSAVSAQASTLSLRKTISRPAHAGSANVTGVNAAIHHDNRPWDRGDDVYLYRHFHTRSLHDWSIYLERSEDMISLRIRHLRQPGNAPV